MPHIIIKLYPGRADTTKQELADKITQNVIDITGCNESAVSIAVEETEPDAWPESVYRPDILECKGKLYKEPGYNPFQEGEEQKEQGGLMDYVRGSSLTAEKEDTSGAFNPMSWLDIALEDNPQMFDSFFNKPWDELSEDEKGKRAMEIRKVL